MMKQIEKAHTLGTENTRHLDLKNVSVSFGGVHALKNVSLQISSSEFVSIVGPNGAGKSTLVQAATGFARPTAGSIRFNSIELSGMRPETISSMGVARTFQTSRVFPALSIGESVLIGTQRELIGGGRSKPRFGALSEMVSVLLGLPAYRAAQDEGEAHAEKVMKLFGDRLWPRRDRPAYSLSYANRRRLDIARALVSAPDLLLLDEPTAGMNPTESAELADLLVSVHDAFPSMMMIMVEHKLDIVRKITSRTIVLAQGEVLADGKPDEVLSSPAVAEAYLGPRGGKPTESPKSGGIHLVSSASASSEQKQTNLIELHDVDVFYGPVQALFKVSLAVKRGETVVVLGGNASGKSTVIKSVLRLVSPRAGQIRVFGKPTDGMETSDVIRMGIASIPEGRRMFAEMTVRDNLLMGAYARREDKRELQDDLERVLSEFPWLRSRIDQLAGTLSGGEQQMVAMGRAWLRRPELLCIDEPSMGLSPLMVDRVYETLARWKSQGLTILMVEQSANRALELADRAYVLRNGALMIDGDAADLRNDETIREAYLGGARQQSPTAATH